MSRLYAKFGPTLVQSARAFWNTVPLMFGVILCIGLVQAYFPPQAMGVFFHHHVWLDSIIGSGIGSVFAGSPITSYVIGGELMNQGVSLIAVTAFMVAWVTVGVVQFPAEALMLGYKFAVLRNILSFLFSICVSVITVFLLSFL